MQVVHPAVKRDTLLGEGFLDDRVGRQVFELQKHVFLDRKA